MGNGAASAGVSHPQSRYPRRSRFLKEVHFFLYDRPSVLGWMSGLGTDPTTEQQGTERQACCSELRAAVSPGGPGAGCHPPVRTLLPTWARAKGGGASLPGQDPALSGPDTQCPLLDSDLLLPHFTPQPPGRAFSHLQLGLPDVTAQGSSMSRLRLVCPGH